MRNSERRLEWVNREDVYRLIDGRQEIGGHGSGEMPLWGTVFKQGKGTERDAALSAHARILEIVYYLESTNACRGKR